MAAGSHQEGAHRWMGNRIHRSGHSIPILSMRWRLVGVSLEDPPMALTQSRLAGPARSLGERAGRFTMRVGNKMVRVSQSPWDRAHSTRDGSGARIESRARRALRLGYVQHGEFDLKIAYDPDVISDKVVNTIERGAYERFEGRRSKSFIDEGDRVIELGAGLGFLSALIMSQTQVGDYQMVEADPRLRDLMKKTHELNEVEGPATIHTCVATCNQDMIAAGSVDFFVGEKFCASSLLGAKNLKHSVEVPVVSLPDMIREHRSNVLIADIEGAETDLFDGTPLDGIEKIIMEIHPHRIGLDGVRDIFRNLDALGFVFDAKASSGVVCGFRLHPEPGEREPALSGAASGASAD